MDDKLSRLLARHIPGFARLISCERLSGGASQETYRLAVQSGGGRRLLALRRGRAAAPSAFGPVPGLNAEARLMRAARRAGVPEPEVIAILAPDDQLGEGFLMEWIEGETLGKRVATAPALAGARAHLAFQCGQILARIHAIDPAAAGLDPRLFAQSPAAALAQVDVIYRGFQTPRPMIDYTACWLKAHLPPDGPTTLVHNDFRNGNLIVTARGVAAVLDWELARLSDPMRDLGWLCANCWRFGQRHLPVGGFGLYPDLVRGYESLAPRRVDHDRVRFWQVFASFSWAVICLSMAAHWRAGGDPSPERAAIGRRASESEIDCANLLIPGEIEAFGERPARAGLDMPEAEEILAAVHGHLRAGQAGQARDRQRFLALVCANMLAVAGRELELGPEHRRRERRSLQDLAGQGGGLSDMRKGLIRRIREGEIPLEDPALAACLRNQTARQVMIDQPDYSGLQTARDGRGEDWHG